MTIHLVYYYLVDSFGIPLKLIRVVWYVLRPASVDNPANSSHSTQEPKGLTLPLSSGLR